MPAIVVIVNNAYLGLIRQNQKYAYNFDSHVEMDENQLFIDYIKVTEGFDCNVERVLKPGDISKALERALQSKKPYVIDIICEEKTDYSMEGSIAAVKEFV